jgi:hypothetical protein
MSTNDRLFLFRLRLLSFAQEIGVRAACPRSLSRRGAPAKAVCWQQDPRPVGAALSPQSRTRAPDQLDGMT